MAHRLLPETTKWACFEREGEKRTMAFSDEFSDAEVLDSIARDVTDLHIVVGGLPPEGYVPV